MLKHIFTCIALSLLTCSSASAQVSKEYMALTEKANALFEAKKYQQCAMTFSEAFAINGGKGMIEDRYNAACAWARAGNNDSAFFQLNRLATRGNFSDYNELTADADLASLRADKRWAALCALVKQNKERKEANLNKPLVALLEKIMDDDQAPRKNISIVEKKYGYNSEEMKKLWKEIGEKDSINEIKIADILDKYGWLGPDVVGESGSTTLFLVVQHADIKMQEKYLPMLRDAVKNNKASASDLALLEDRVALRQRRKQIYGSQIHSDPNGHPWVSPLEDPDNVDKRRAAVGLGPIADYLALFNIKWDVEEYKKQLPEIEKKEGK